MLKSRFIICLMFFSITWSCGPSDKQVKDELSEYLREAFTVKLEEAMYILVPMNSCDGCRQTVYRNLLAAEVQKTHKVVLIGEVREALTLNYINRLKGKGIEVLQDPNEIATQYGLLEEDYPMKHIMFIDVEQGEVLSMRALTSSMINGEVDIRKEIFKGHIK